MRTINLAALAVIIGGGAVLARPAHLSATYFNPWGSSGMTFCCQTGETASCCGSAGCGTKAGVCLIFS